MPRGLREALLKRVIHAQPDTVKSAINSLLDELRISEMTEASAREFQKLAGRDGLKLHLGCGDDVKTGWVNVALRLNQPPPLIDPAAQPDTFFMNYDLRRELPLADGSCAAIYSSHFFEHLECRDGLRLMRECYRVLRPGGVFRIALPNLKRFFAAYLEGDQSYVDILDPRELMPEIEPGTETYVDHLNYGVYYYGEHKCIYDEEKLLLLLKNIGFGSAVESSFQSGIDPAAEIRRRYSFYVEAVK
jgi:predicted SAM-dependent methyltransferase